MANASVKKISAGNKRLFESLINSFIATFVFKNMVLSLLGRSSFTAISLFVIITFIGVTFYLKSQSGNGQVPLNSGFNQYVVDGIIILTVCNLLAIVSEWLYLLSLVTFLLPFKGLLLNNRRK